MGAACGKETDGSVLDTSRRQSSCGGDLCAVMFQRCDKGHKGYLDINDLKTMMQDSKAHFQGKDAQHVLQKYGTDDRMNPKEFKSWWNSTYTTYNDDAIANLVEQVKAENNMDIIPENRDNPSFERKHSEGEVINRS